MGKLLISHRSTICPCSLPGLGGFNRSWSYKTYPGQKYTIRGQNTTHCHKKIQKTDNYIKKGRGRLNKCIGPSTFFFTFVTMESKNAFTKNAMNFGAICGLTLIVVFFVLQTLGMARSAIEQLLSYLITILFIFLGTKKFRDEFSGGIISYGKAVWSGVLISFFSAFLLGFFMYIFLQYIDPSTIDKILEQSEQQMLESGNSDEQIEVAMEYVRKFSTPSVISIMSVLLNTFLGLVFSLVIGAFVKKEPGGFDQFIEQNQ
jgi:hypothetical protein